MDDSPVCSFYCCFRDLAFEVCVAKKLRVTDCLLHSLEGLDGCPPLSHAGMRGTPFFQDLLVLLLASPLHKLDPAYCSLTAFSVSRSCLKLKDLGNDHGISFAQSCFFNYNSFLPDLLLRRFV